MKKLIAILSIIVFSCFTSCYDDKGNYDYHAINEIKITGLPEQPVYAFKYATELNIKPIIKGTLAADNTESYDYLWKAIIKQGTNSEQKNEYVLGTERDLTNYLVTLPEADYTIFLFIKDKSSDVSWRESFELKVTTATREGWIVLSDQKGDSRIDMIANIGGEDIISRDLIGNYNIPCKKSPKKIGLLENMFNSLNPLRITLYTETGTTYLNYDYLYWDESESVDYEFAEMHANPIIQDMRGEYTSGSNVCIVDGKIYFRNNSLNGAIFGEPIKKAENEQEEFNLAPYLITTGQSYSYNAPYILYDNSKKRFLQLTLDYYGPTISKCLAPEIAFKNQVDKELISVNNTPHNKGCSFMVFQDNANKMWLYSFVIGYSLSQNKDYHYQINAPEIENATMFAVHPFFYYLFYVANNKIYQFDMVTKNSRIVPYDFGTEKITMIKFNPFQMGTYNKPQSYVDLQYNLIVGTTTTTTTTTDNEELNGKVTMLKITSGMNDKVELVNSYSGFAKPVDVKYRERM